MVTESPCLRMVSSVPSSVKEMSDSPAETLKKFGSSAVIDLSKVVLKVVPRAASAGQVTLPHDGLHLFEYVCANTWEAKRAAVAASMKRDMAGSGVLNVFCVRVSRRGVRASLTARYVCSKDWLCVEMSDWC